MPRPNRARSLESEENLQHRIAWEREQRGMTYEGLAKRMTDLGCAIHASAIYKIEKGNPPRKVTVSELIALSKIFETTTDELLVPLDLRHVKLAAQIFRRVEDVIDAVDRAANELEAAGLEMRELAAGDPRANDILTALLAERGMADLIHAAWTKFTDAADAWSHESLDVQRATIAAFEAWQGTQSGGESK